MQMWIGHTTGEAFLSGAIRWATKGDFSHSLVIFGESDKETYFESFARKNPETGISGVRQRPFSNLQEWLPGHPKRRLCLQRLPYDDESVEKARRYAEACVGKIPYAPLQIFQNLKLQFTGYPSNVGDESPKKHTCSEFASHCWWEANPVDADIYLKLGYTIYDWIAPDGRKRYALRIAVNNFLKDHGLAPEVIIG